jgi:hypothetical protein
VPVPIPSLIKWHVSSRADGRMKIVDVGRLGRCMIRLDWNVD